MSKHASSASGIQLFPILRVPFSPSPQAALLTLRRIRAENRFAMHLMAWGAGSLFFITMLLAFDGADGPPVLAPVISWGAVVLAHGLRMHRGGRRKYHARLRALVPEKLGDSAAEPVEAAEADRGAGMPEQARKRLLEAAEQVRDVLRPVSPESLAEVSRGETRALALVSWLDDAERLMRYHRAERGLRRHVANRLSEARDPDERQELGKLLALLDRHQQRLGSLERRARDHRSRVESFLLALDNVKIARAACCDLAVAAVPLRERVARLADAGPAAGDPLAEVVTRAALPATSLPATSLPTTSLPATSLPATESPEVPPPAASLRADRLRQEVRLARDLQRSILPAAAPEVPGLDVAHVYRPSSEVGGDFYDFYVTGEGRLLIALGDASGHGLDSSMVSSMAKSALYMQVSAAPDPGSGVSTNGGWLADALAEINRMMCDTLGRRRMMTLTLVELDVAAGAVSWVNAGQVYPLLRRGGEVRELDQPGYPLGVRRRMSPRVKRLALEPGDLLLLLTDGYFEATDGAGEPFGWQRLSASLAGSQATAPGTLLDRLAGELSEYLRDQPAQDDVTLIAVAFRP